jgi:hypothetical protein
LLYNSDVLLFDRRTESLFSQMMFQAVSGPLRGIWLQVLPSRTTTWAAWKKEHPATLVLSRALPYGRDYNSDPYHFYRRSGTTMFSVKGADRSRNSKTCTWITADSLGMAVFLASYRGYPPYCRLTGHGSGRHQRLSVLREMPV